MHLSICQRTKVKSEHEWQGISGTGTLIRKKYDAKMKVIDTTLLDKVSSEAKESPRLRMNYNFHLSLDDKCHRFLNAVEPGTKVEIHRHPTKDESFVLLRGRVRVNTI